MSWLLNNILLLIAILFGIGDMVFWFIHVIKKHDDPVKKRNKEAERDKKKIESLTAELDKIKEKYHVEVKK